MGVKSLLKLGIERGVFQGTTPPILDSDYQVVLRIIRPDGIVKDEYWQFNEEYFTHLRGVFQKQIALRDITNEVNKKNEL